MPPRRLLLMLLFAVVSLMLVTRLGVVDTRAAPSTWSGWAQVRSSHSPPARHMHALAYDSLRARTILFGGEGGYSGSYEQLSDTWEFDGTDWTQTQTSTSPSTRTDHALAFDSARGRTILFGGLRSSYIELNDTWEYDGTSWVGLSPSTSPSPRYSHVMTYDSVSTQNGALRRQGRDRGAPC